MMNILMLNTGLFPDQETVLATEEHLGQNNSITHFDISTATQDDPAWDQLAIAILASDQIITL